MLDESGHLATSVIVLANLPAAGPGWTAAYAIGSVGVDIDHLPLVRVRHSIRKDDPRPAVHTFLVPVGLGVAARFTRGRARELVLGLTTGTWVHFLRDLATGTGVAPLRPLTRRRIKAPHKAYLLAVGLLAARAWRLAR